MSTEWRVAVGADHTTAVIEPGTGGHSDVVFVCAHGAGGSTSQRDMVSMASELASRAVTVVRFNFLYKEKGSGRPDPMPRLKECVASVVEHAREELAPRLLFIGGRSMGGRAASMLAADGFACDGLILLAYPLHPAGKPEQLRDKHLRSIKVPVLCFNGTRDALCRRDLMESVLEPVTTRWEMHWLEGADHGFHVLKSSGRTDGAVLAEVGAATQRWVADIPPRDSLSIRP